MNENAKTYLEELRLSCISIIKAVEETRSASLEDRTKLSSIYLTVEENLILCMANTFNYLLTIKKN